MTLEEFIQPLSKSTHRERCLAVLYFAQDVEGVDGLTAAETKTRLVKARVPKVKAMNASDVLAKAGHFVHAPAVDDKGARVWSLTPSGKRHVRELLALPVPETDVAHDVSVLTGLASSIKDDVARSYVDEAIVCLRAGAFRAAIVFLWSGAMRSMQERALDRFGAKPVSQAVQKHDPKARPVSKVDDFAQVRDRVALLAIRELSLVDKGEWTTLGEALDLRNRCGHPTKYRPGVKKASSFVEDLLGIVFA